MLPADEPTGALDSHTGRAVMDQVNELHGGGLSIVLDTHHDTQVADRRAGRLVRIKDGRIVAN